MLVASTKEHVQNTEEPTTTYGARAERAQCLTSAMKQQRNSGENRAEDYKTSISSLKKIGRKWAMDGLKTDWELRVVRTREKNITRKQHLTHGTPHQAAG